MATEWSVHVSDSPQCIYLVIVVIVASLHGKRSPDGNISTRLCHFVGEECVLCDVAAVWMTHLPLYILKTLVGLF